MGQKSRLKKFARNAINQKDINNAFLGKLPDGLKTRVTNNIKTQDTQMAQMLKGFAESFITQKDCLLMQMQKEAVLSNKIWL